MSGSVFGETVDRLLDTVDVSDPRFGNRKFTYTSDTARVGISAVTSGENTFTSRDDFPGMIREARTNERREAFADALVGTLLERQYTWGAMFNYPRTFVVGREARYKPGKSRFDQSSLPPVADVDQVVVVNVHGSTENVEILVVRLHQENRKGSRVEYEVGGLRFESAGTTSLRSTIEDEAKNIITTMWPSADLTFTRVGEMPVSSISYGGSDDPLAPFKAAAVHLERIMRDRTTPLEDLVQSRSTLADYQPHMDHLFKALYSGQVPYAAADLDPRTQQPHVMPGDASPERVAQMYLSLVLGQGVGGGSMPVAASTPNPYDRMVEKQGQAAAVTTDADIDSSSPGTLSPFSDEDEEDAL